MKDPYCPWCADNCKKLDDVTWYCVKHKLEIKRIEIK